MRIALIALVLFFTGCSSVAIDHQVGTDFARFQTWAYSDPGGEAESLDAQRIKQAVRKYIGITGLEKASEQEADLLVRGRVVDTSRLESSGLSFGFGTRHDHVGFGMVTAPPVREVEEGKVVVEMVTRERNQVIWRAEGRRHLSPGMSPESRTELVNKLVREMFEKYPPGNKR